MHALAIFLLVLGCLSCSPGASRVEREFPLNSCADLAMQGNLQLQARTGDVNILHLIATSVDDYTISLRDDGFALRIGSVDDPVHAALTCSQWGSMEALGAVQVQWENAPGGLYKLALYGASSAHLAKLSGEHADLRVAGAARMQVAEVSLDRTDLMLSGAGEMTLAGSTTTLSVDATGSAELDAAVLQAQSVTINAQGATVLSVWATAHLGGQASASAQLDVRGNPDRHLTFKGDSPD